MKSNGMCGIGVSSEVFALMEPSITRVVLVVGFAYLLGG